MKNHIIREESLIEHFSSRAEKYDDHSDWVNDQEILQLMVDDLVESKKNHKILDLGAGTGAVAKYILKRNSEKEIIALDICQNMLDRIKDLRITTICADAEEIPFKDRSFDVVISRQCLHYIKDLDKVLNEVNRVLKPGGIFILAQIVPYNQETADDWAAVTKIRQPFRMLFYTSEEWDFVMKKHFLVPKKSYRYIKKASVKIWKEKYACNNKREQEYKDKLLAMNETYKEIYAIKEIGNDIKYLSFWYIAQYLKEST